MASKSKHFGDVYIWLIQVIKSCKTIDQLNTAENLIKLFEDKHKDYKFDFNTASTLSRNLYKVYFSKLNYLLYQKL